MQQLINLDKHNENRRILSSLEIIHTQQGRVSSLGLQTDLRTVSLLLLGSGGFSFHRFFPKMYIIFLYLLSFFFLRTRVKIYPQVLEGFLFLFTYKALEMFFVCVCERKTLLPSFCVPLKLLL